MNPREPGRTERELRLFGVPIVKALSRRQIRVGILLFVAYLAATRISGALFAAPAVIFPAAGIAFGALFLEGISLWPFVFGAALLGYFFDGALLPTLLIMPVAHTLQAVCGAWLLRRLDVDPILRRNRDIFSILLVAFVSATIVPTMGQLARFLDSEFYGAALNSVTWFSWWSGLVLSILILTPFVLRWFAKPHFTRTLRQATEIAIVLGSVVALSYLLFWTTYTSIGGVSMDYILLLPLFWIALRIGPRFLTLALVLLSSVAISGAFFGVNAGTPEDLGRELMQTVIYLDVVAIIFFLIVTIEEERRMATKLLTSQIGSLRNALDQLAEQDKAKNEFIAVVAHELRNPLTPVIASLDLLKERVRDPEDIKTLTFMESCMMTARRLLEDLLDASRANQKKLVLEQQVTDLVKVVHQASASRQHTLKEREQVFTLSVPETPVYVHGDAVRLEQIVMNLLVNASKFTKVGGSISVSLSVVGGQARIEVTDSGIGLSPEMLEKIFEPFTQVEQGDLTRKGLGIGLALVRQLTEMHGGRASAISAGLGHGSTFRVDIPLLPETVTVPEASKPTLLKPERTARGTVLIVDDNDAAAYSVGRLLELKGYSVDYAYDGTHALEQAQSLTPDTILLDIGLPDIDGFKVATQLRQNGYTGNLVALTGYGSDEERAKSTEAGFNHHLVKPVGIAELRRVL